MSSFAGYTMSLIFRALLVVCLLQPFVLPGTAYAQRTGPITVSSPVTPLHVNVDLRRLEVRGPRPMVTVPEGEPLPTLPPVPEAPIPDPVIQLRPGASEPGAQVIGPPILNFAGLTSNSNPPDTVGDVGPNHYVQMVNATFFQVWDKSGNALTRSRVSGCGCDR
jgi:hypothetical protein